MVVGLDHSCKRTHEDPGDSQSDRRKAGLLEGPSLRQPLPSRMPVEGDGGRRCSGCHKPLIRGDSAQGVTSGQWWWEIRRKKILVEMEERTLITGS